MQFQKPLPTETVETLQQTQSIAFALRFILLQVGSLKCDDWGAHVSPLLVWVYVCFHRDHQA